MVGNGTVTDRNSYGQFHRDNELLCMYCARQYAPRWTVLSLFIML